jgi:osmotically-inducible protein OsmY
MNDAVSEEVIDAISEALAAEPRVNSEATSIDVRIERDGIALDGRVSDIITKRVAGNLSWRVAGKAVPLYDRLRVIAGDETEAELVDHIVTALTNECVFSNHTLIIDAGGVRETLHDGGSDPGHITVTLDGRVVTLTGQVVSLSHRRLAEVLVWWTAGSELVVNQLDVVPPEEDHDDEITDVIRMVLEKNPLVHASQLSCATAGGVVELDGFVASDEERRLAVLDAWYVPGVWEVVDRIRVQD